MQGGSSSLSLIKAIFTVAGAPVVEEAASVSAPPTGMRQRTGTINSPSIADADVSARSR